MSNIKGRPLSAAIDDALRQLASVEHFQAGSLVSLPVIYPSGASVVLEVTRHAGRWLVSDRGGGSQEAELMGGLRYFREEAARIASEAGIRFDRFDMFAAEASSDVLAGAMAVVANCSQDATALAAQRMSVRVEAEARDVLFARLSSVFKGKRVERDAEVIGASNHKWKVAVLVEDRKRRALFEPVSKNYVSIVGTAAKFHDFARLEPPPERFAVIKSMDEIGDYYGVIAAASTKVIESSVSDEAIRELAA